MAVRIYLEIGHEASIRTKKTQEGFTHDWEVFVRGIDGAEIHYYVEKVVFYLHETFPKPKRVVKEPPYSVKESGYAGFNLPIDIYLRNNNDPKKIRFNYDLHLQQSGPPILKVQKEKYVFNSPSDDFKMKLLKGGGTIGGSSNTQESSDNRSSSEDKNQMINKPKLSGSDFVKKPKLKIGEPCRDFQELFGSPINMSSRSSEQKPQAPKQESKDKSRKHSPHKESHKDKEKSKDKTDSEKKNRDEKKQKEKSKDRERSKDKSVKKEKSPRPKSPSPKRSPKRSASPSRFSSPPVIKHKESKHDKEKRDKIDERKAKKEKKSKEHKENKHEEQKTVPEEHKEKVRTESKKESKPKIEKSVSPPPPKVTEKKEKSKDKSSKESSKDDKYSEKYKHKKKDKEKREKKEEKVSKPEKKPEKAVVEPKPSLFKNEIQPKKEKSNYHDAIVPNIEDESSNSSTSSSSSSSIERIPEKKPKSEPVKMKEETKPKVKKEKGYQENTIKCKRKSNSVEPEEPPQKMHKEQNINNNSDVEQEKPAKTVVPAASEPVEEDYFGLLRDLQHKIMGLKDNSDLQKVVKLIAETGRYEVSAHTFDFDLCLLDRSTVKQLQEFFASET